MVVTLRFKIMVSQIILELYIRAIPGAFQWEAFESNQPTMGGRAQLKDNMKKVDKNKAGD